jgi:hypothetical protein
MPILWRSCNSVEALSFRLSERINSRTVIVRSDSPSGLRLVLSLNRPGVGVGNDTVRLSSLSMKRWPGVESVDVLAAFLVCSECWRECVNGSSGAIVG